MNNAASLSPVVLRRKPHPQLQPFISHYVFRNIHFPQDICVQKAMPIRIHSSIDFYMGDPFETIDYRTGQSVPFERCTIRGPRTSKLYFIRLTGHFISFSIKLKAVGLFHLTGLPMCHFTNQSIPGKQFLQLPLQVITDKLQEANTISDCIAVVESYLFWLTEKYRFRSDAVEMSVQQLIRQVEPHSIIGLAAESHLSIRQLERLFAKEVGVSPKMFYRMNRFQKLIHSRIDDPFTKWAALAEEFNYYDQRHLLRDFRQFLGINPSDFVPDDYAL